jgi:hypothetical protein
MSVKLSEPLGYGTYHRESGSTRDVEYYIMSEGILDDIGYGYDKPTGDCFFIVRHWYAGSNKLFQELNDGLEWNELKLPIRGKLYTMKRLIHLMSDEPSIDSTVWHPDCEIIKNRLLQELLIDCEHAILNLYKTGDDFIPYHTDRGIGGYADLVATVSLGGTRRFYLKNNSDNSVIKTELHSGDLVIMSGNIQKLYKHTIPKQKNSSPRISITMRE